MSFLFQSIQIRVQERGSCRIVPAITRRTAFVVVLAIGAFVAQASAETDSSARLVGVGSCTAAGCHGGAKKDRPVIGSEYNIWLAQDPHAGAYNTLLEERSEKIVRNLGNKPDKPAYKDPRCLACHATTEAVGRETNPEIISDGVSCESCHGAASTWLSRHYESTPDAARRKDIGMSETKNLFERAKICASCHVGSPGPDSSHGRDVNHDLIAAGHPRLQFEMSAFLLALPKHWDKVKDRKEWGADFDAGVWATGQAATAWTSAKQLANRAERGIKDKRQWPEFSEWTCGTCHHDLRMKEGESRQLRIANANKLNGGLFEWDAWNHFMTSKHTSDISSSFSLADNAGDSVAQLTERLSVKMSTAYPTPEDISKLANQTADALEQWGQAIESTHAGSTAAKKPVKVNQLSRSIVDAHLAAGSVDWSSAAQTYDALASLQDSRLWQTRLNGPPSLNDPFSNFMRRLFKELAAKHDPPSDYLEHPELMEAQWKELLNKLPDDEPKSK